MDLKIIKDSTAAAGAEAKKLVADKLDGRSPFAAGIRSNLDHATDLIVQHEKWLAANPVSETKKPAATETKP